MRSLLSRSHLLTRCGHIFARKSTSRLRLMSTYKVVRLHFHDCKIVLTIQFSFLLLVRLKMPVSYGNVRSRDGPYLILIKFWSDEVSIMMVTFILHVQIFKQPRPSGCHDAGITCVGIHVVS